MSRFRPRLNRSVGFPILAPRSFRDWLSIMPLFNQPSQHDALLVQLANVKGLSNFASNLMYDHRVSQERATEYRKFLPDPSLITPQSFKTAAEEYRKERVQQSPFDFLNKKINGNNDPALHPISAPLRRTRFLTRVLNLSRLSPLFFNLKSSLKNKYAALLVSSAPSRRRSTTTLRSTGPLNPAFDALMNDQDWIYNSPCPPTTNKLCQLIVDLLNDNPKHNPVWATWWSRLSSIVSSWPIHPEKWLTRLGVEANEGDWIALLKYPLSHAGTLIRPTVLDTKPESFHFPSPPSKPLEHGGCTMSLVPDYRRLLPEWIHGQGTWMVDHFVAVVKMKAAIKVSPTARDFHRNLISQHFPKDYNWYR